MNYDIPTSKKTKQAAPGRENALPGIDLKYGRHTLVLSPYGRIWAKLSGQLCTLNDKTIPQGIEFKTGWP